MRKSSFMYSVVAFMLLIPTIAPAQVKMGYIDSNRILQEFEEVRDAQAKLEKETPRLQAEYNVYVTRLDSLQRDFEKQRLLLSNEMMRTKEAEMQGLLRTTQQFQQQYQRHRPDCGRPQPSAAGVAVFGIPHGHADSGDVGRALA